MSKPNLTDVAERLTRVRSRLHLIYDCSVWTDSPLSPQGQEGVVVLLHDIEEEISRLIALVEPGERRAA